ncbi:MAG: pilus assembly protein TadG-related protein [Candidatus Nitricoxidivorans perseverans]|uniref:Pilus assembly protein TadG-related protein n=1 Tax=Candidatus Nitricoxidivorans perseverans TaxID=2975601 RepID=A0AA49FLQ7_9PROT|nr:MAG: pilus assembly protein TadG-related protein [Candidatus Nitricoxidivorans perseverans]
MRRPAKAGGFRARQRGAIGFFGVLNLLLALIFTAMAVDAGRLWFERRKVQAVADIAALEAARNLGCGGNPGNALAAAQAAADRNGFTGDLSVAVGGLTTVDGLRQFNTDTSNESAHVVATKPVPASLVLGGLFGQTTRMSAEATARAEPAHATFSAGSYLARVSATDKDANLLSALLGSLLGSSLSLDVLSYQGLASTEVNLLQLVKASASVGTVEELLAADLTVADVIGLTATALGQQGVVDASVTAAMQNLLTATVNNLDVRLGEVLDVSMPGSDAAAKVGINVFDLITTTILVANKERAVSLPSLSVNLGGLLNINVSVDIISPPQIAVGPPGRDAATGLWCTQARTAQLGVTASVVANVLGLANIDLGLGVQLAQGEAHLETLDLTPGATQAVIGATPGIAALNLTNAAGSGPAMIKLLGLTIATIAPLDLSIQPPSPTDLVFPIDSPVAEHLPTATQSVSSSIGSSLESALSNPDLIHIELLPDSLGPLLDLLLGLLGLDLNDLLGDLLSEVLAPLLGFIGGAVLDPLLKLLGIQLGGLDVTIQNIQYNGGARLVI